MSGLAIEKHVESAASELLKAYTSLVDEVGGAGKVRDAFRRDLPTAYPAATFQAVAFGEFHRHSGWYMGILRLSAHSYRADDQNNDKVKAILGWLREWSQQTDLVTQFNNTTSAQAATTLLTVDDIVCDGLPFDEGEGSPSNEMVLDVTILARPSVGENDNND